MRGEYGENEQPQVLRLRLAQSAPDFAPDDKFVMGARRSGTDETGVEGAGDGDVSSALDDGSAVGEEGESERATTEAEDEIVAAEILNVRVSAEAGAEGGEVDGTAVLVNLHGVSAAEGDVGAVLAGEVGEDALAADLAIGSGSAG